MFQSWPRTKDRASAWRQLLVAVTTGPAVIVAITNHAHATGIGMLETNGMLQFR